MDFPPASAPDLCLWASVSPAVQRKGESRSPLSELGLWGSGSKRPPTSEERRLETRGGRGPAASGLLSVVLKPRPPWEPQPVVERARYTHLGHLSSHTPVMDTSPLTDTHTHTHTHTHTPHLSPTYSRDLSCRHTPRALGPRPPQSHALDHTHGLQ